MHHRFSINNRLAVAATVLGLAASALAGCAVSLPPMPLNNPANAHAAEAATPPLRPSLLANSRTFLTAQADDREQKAKRMDMSDMTGMQGMSHDSSPSAAPKGSYYTCPMHPEIHEAKPGECPKCGMTLIKKSAAAAGAKP